MSRLDKEFVANCKKKLLETKAELLNRIKDSQLRLRTAEKAIGGDEADQSMNIIAENEALSTQERLRFTLREIEVALAKIESGAYGICEETEEPIEPQRLLSIPWTRLSIEGAEVRESMNKRYAR